jgi:hypothetical protein
MKKILCVKQDRETRRIRIKLPSPLAEELRRHVGCERFAAANYFKGLIRRRFGKPRDT